MTYETDAKLAAARAEGARRSLRRLQDAITWAVADGADAAAVQAAIEAGRTEGERIRAVRADNARREPRPAPRREAGERRRAPGERSPLLEAWLRDVGVS